MKNWKHRQNRNPDLAGSPHAFKSLTIHEIPQFILHIAVRYVLHHYSSQDIHHCKILEDSEISEESFVKCREEKCKTFFQHHL